MAFKLAVDMLVLYYKAAVCPITKTWLRPTTMDGAFNWELAEQYIVNGIGNAENVKDARAMARYANAKISPITGHSYKCP